MGQEGTERLQKFWAKQDPVIYTTHCYMSQVSARLGMVMQPEVGALCSIRAKASKRLQASSLNPHLPTLVKGLDSAKAEWHCVSTGRAPFLPRPPTTPTPGLGEGASEATCLTDKIQVSSEKTELKTHS